jgi:hypothetical protein
MENSCSSNEDEPDHTVPLMRLSILEMMKSLSGGREFIFPSRIKPTQPMNSQTVNAVLKRAGLGGVLVSHGLRSIASTALNEKDFRLMSLKQHWLM